MSDNKITFDIDSRSARMYYDGISQPFTLPWFDYPNGFQVYMNISCPIVKDNDETVIRGIEVAGLRLVDHD